MVAVKGTFDLFHQGVVSIPVEFGRHPGVDNILNGAVQIIPDVDSGRWILLQLWKSVYGFVQRFFYIVCGGIIRGADENLNPADGLIRIIDNASVTYLAVWKKNRFVFRSQKLGVNQTGLYDPAR